MIQKLMEKFGRGGLGVPGRPSNEVDQRTGAFFIRY
jgi:hypothetical protein